MKFDITDPVEAHLVMIAVQNAKLDYLIASAQPGERGEHADVCAKVLGRVEQRIVDTFIPDLRREDAIAEIELGIF